MNFHGTFTPQADRDRLLAHLAREERQAWAQHIAPKAGAFSRPAWWRAQDAVYTAISRERP